MFWERPGQHLPGLYCLYTLTDQELHYLSIQKLFSAPVPNKIHSVLNSFIVIINLAFYKLMSEYFEKFIKGSILFD
jgi:hypothetical protein